MTSRHYSASSDWTYENLDSLRPYPSTTNFYTGRSPPLEFYTFQHSVLADPTAARGSGLPAVLPIIRPADPQFLSASQENGALAGAEVAETHLIQPHVARPSYGETATQTVNLHATSECKDGQGELQAHQPVSRKLAPQEIYKPARQKTGFESPGVVEFVVDGTEGIRLSDALGGNWGGLEGRDDRSLFEGDRLQILLRLNLVGCSPWHSKIPTADFTVRRRPITRMRLAAGVARCIKKFIAREKSNGHHGGHPRCDWGDVSLENVFLTRIVRVSAASWQPEIFVERSSIASQAASSSSLSANPLSTSSSSCGSNLTCNRIQSSEPITTGS